MVAHKPDKGTLTIEVARFTIQFKDPWRVQIGAGNRFDWFFLSNNTTHPMMVQWDDVPSDEKLYVSASSFGKHQKDCELLFTVDELMNAGVLGVEREYKPHQFCSLVMTVSWDPK